MSRRPSIGILVEGATKDLSRCVTELLRIVTAKAPPEVLVAALHATTEIEKRPVTINNCRINMNDD